MKFDFDFRRTSYMYKSVITNVSREAERILNMASSVSVDYEKLRHLYFIKDGCKLWLDLIKADPDLCNVKGDINKHLNRALEEMFKNRGSYNMCLDFVQDVLIYDNYSPSYILKSNIGMYNTFLKEVLSCKSVYSLLYGDDYSENLKFRLNLLRDGDYDSEVIGLDEVGLDKPHYYTGRLYTSLNDLIKNFDSLYTSLSTSVVKKLYDLNVLPPIFSRQALEQGKLELCWPYNLISSALGTSLSETVENYRNINVNDFINNFSSEINKSYSSEYLGVIKDYYCYNLSMKDISLKYKMGADKVRNIVRKIPKEVIRGMNLALDIDEYRIAFNKKYPKKFFGSKIMLHLNSLSGQELMTYGNYYSVLLKLKDLGANMKYICSDFSKDIKTLIPEALKYDNLTLVYDADLTSFDMIFLEFLVNCSDISSDIYIKYDYIKGNSKTSQKQEFIDDFLSNYSSSSAIEESYRFGLLLIFLKTGLIASSEILNWVTVDDKIGASPELPSGELCLIGDTRYCARLGQYIENQIFSFETLNCMNLCGHDIAEGICKHLKKKGFYTFNAVAFYMKNKRLSVFKQFTELEIKVIKYVSKTFGIE